MPEPKLSFVGRVPLRTYEAAVRDGPRAAILFFHGLRSSGDVLGAEARAIADAGITAILPDAPHHGARRSIVLETMPDSDTREGYATLLAILREARDEVPALVAHAVALGYEKVAIGGVSMGAFIALAAAGIEPRLAAFVSVLGSPDWTPRTGEAANAVDDLRDALEESPHHSPEVFAPRPLLLLNGARDASVVPGPARALAARLRPLYEAHGAGDALVHREYDVPHAVPEDVWKEMIATTTSFLVRVLVRSLS